MRCPVLHVTMQAHVCVERQDARQPGAHSPAAFLPCGTGTCDFGNRVRKTMPRGWAPKPFRMLRGDLKTQRKARIAFYRRTIANPYSAGIEPVYREVPAPPLPPAIVEQLVQLTRKPEVPMAKPLKPMTAEERRARDELLAAAKAQGPLHASPPLPDPEKLPSSYLLRCAEVLWRKMREHVLREPG